jgi:hypothetical protein
MPKAKLTDEQKTEMYEKWLTEPEALQIAKLGEKRPSAPALELATKDINTNIQEFLTTLFDTVAELKVPGRKAKCKLSFFNS